MHPTKLSKLFRDICKVIFHWFLILIIPAIVLSFIILPFVIKIKSISCSTQYGDCPTDMQTKLDSLTEKSVFAAERGVKSNLSQNLLVQRFVVRFSFPATLKVDIITKKTAFCITGKNSNQFALVDQSGIILGLSQNCSFPLVLSAPSERIPGGHVSDSDLFALKIIQGIYQMYQVTQISASTSGLTVELPGTLRVIFPSSGDVSELLGALRLIVTKITSDFAGKYREIDLRFESPVLR